MFSSVLLSDDLFLMLKQEAYKGMASALSEADGIDYTDPEEVGPKSMIPKFFCYICQMIIFFWF